MVLQGAARQAVEGFLRRPPQMDPALLVLLEQGCVANDITYAMLQSINQRPTRRPRASGRR